MLPSSYFSSEVLIWHLLIQAESHGHIHGLLGPEARETLPWRICSSLLCGLKVLALLQLQVEAFGLLFEVFLGQYTIAWRRLLLTVLEGFEPKILFDLFLVHFRRLDAQCFDHFGRLAVAQ